MLANGWQNNPHGAGYMFAVDGVLHIRKAFFTLRELRRAYYADHRAHGATSAFVLHFRWATHGSRGEGNVHPHALAGGAVGLVHNGILWDFDFDKVDSDTVTFCNTVMACRSVDNLMSPELGTFLAELIGMSNRFVLLAHDGRAAIINEEHGIWEDSRWYSNIGYLPPKPQAKWSWVNDGAVARGVVCGSTSWVPERHRETALLAMTDAQADRAEFNAPASEDAIEELRDMLADATLRGDETEAESLERDIAEFEAERDYWGQAELEYGIR